MADPLAVLEQRINVLEEQIRGNCTEIPEATTVTDCLLQAQTMISSALRCRDAITGVLNSMELINDSIDPLCTERMVDEDYKWTYLLDAYESLKSTFLKLGKTSQDFEKFLDSDVIRTLIENGDRIESASASNLQVYETSRAITENVFQTLLYYNHLMETIKIIFRQLNLLLQVMEFEELPVGNKEE